MDARFEGRRGFLRQGATVLGSIAAAGPFEALASRAGSGSNVRGIGYGELVPARDASTGLSLLRLPKDFRYVSFGWTGDRMSDGSPTPPAHDGMAVIAERDDKVVLCRNHEIDAADRPFGPEAITFDAKGAAGCTSLVFDTRQEKLVESRPTLSGTLRNCAGGATPWGSWLSCEETVEGPESNKGFERTHGWIFEVPSEGEANARPLEAMGRFVHEAVAVDPETGVVYETEDRDDAGFYRFVPTNPGSLSEGGRLEMMRVVGQPDLRRNVPSKASFDVEWVAIDEPTKPHDRPGDAAGVFSQGKRQGATTFSRLEGCVQAGGKIYFTATSGGNAGKGQVWEFDPRRSALRLVFESPAATVLDYPDNLTVSPRGGILLCEDGGQPVERLHGLTTEGELFPFAENDIVLHGEHHGIRGDFREQEWAGATFSRDGRWLFVNIQTPGVTFAITGPWERGAL